MWHNMYGNVMSLVLHLGFLVYNHQWWRPQLDRFVNQSALRTRFPKATIEQWYKESRAKGRPLTSKANMHQLLSH